MKEIEIEIEALTNFGESVGHYDNKPVFVPYAIPKEAVQIEIVKEKAKFLRGRIKNILSASPHRITPICPLFQKCGGCSFQHIAYEHQLKLKKKFITDLLASSGFPQAEELVKDPIASPSAFNYRNRGDFSIDENFNLGFKTKFSHNFFPVPYCYLMHEEINNLLAKIQGKKPKTKTHNIVIRYGINTGSYLIQPEIELQNIKTGQKFYWEKIENQTFRISPPSFFQVNTPQAERIIQIIMKEAENLKTAVDAYAGVGTFAFFLSQKAQKAISIEESYTAYQDSRENLNNLKNIKYFNEKVENVLTSITDEVDLIILDPPRSGCTDKVLKAVNAKKIIYVSCDLASLVRDVKILSALGYKLKEIQPLDMFPQTYHIENIAVMNR